MQGSGLVVETKAEREFQSTRFLLHDEKLGK